LGDYTKIGGALQEAGGLNIALGGLALIFGMYLANFISNFLVNLGMLMVGVPILITGTIIKNI